MLQVRVSLPAFTSGVNFTDPIILENADNITLSKTVNSSDESITFDLPLNDPKMPYVNYLRWWECWDTETGQRKNYGPIHSIARASGEVKKIGGPGRSALLNDFYKSIQTFYYPIDEFFDDLRYENIAAEPRTTAVIEKNSTSDYYGVSDRTKIRAIDEQTGYIAIGRDVPNRGVRRTDSYWAGTGRSDWLIIDLGDEFTISRTRLLMPWWSGATIYNKREYTFELLYSDGTNYLSPNSNSFTQVYASPSPGYHFEPEFGGTKFYYGEDPLGVRTITASANPAVGRYWKINIDQTWAYTGSVFDPSTKVDIWDWECGQSNILQGNTVPSPTVSTGDLIGKTDLTISSDCFASVVEFTADRKILDVDTVSKLTYHQIDGNNRAITYFSPPRSEFDFAMYEGATKFEPGNYFRKIQFISLLGVDCTFKDDYNVPIFSGPSGSTFTTPAYAKFVTSTNPFSVDYVDCWNGSLDPFSYAGTYTWSVITGSKATLHFRGVSWKWFATVPADKNPGHVSIKYRWRPDGPLDVWTAWVTLEANLVMPTDVAAEKIYEITYESGLLQLGNTYEIEIENLDGGFVSIDSFAGYWESTMNTVNEDDSRVIIRLPNNVEQHYSARFSAGSIYEYKASTGAQPSQGLRFYGDRVIVYSRKGPNYGTLKLGLFDITDGPFVIIPIPGGEADGSLEIDLNFPYDVAQAVVFDSAEYFTGTDTLDWGYKSIVTYKVDPSDVIWVDGFEVNETSGVSVKFLNTPHLEILKNTAEALQMEWDITEQGLKVVPRLGTDTNVVFAEGRGVTIKIQDVQDVSLVATQLISSGADIDGLPLSTVVEDKNTRRAIGRTIQRLYDQRNVGDYFTLIGAARTELLRRRTPQKRITLQTTDMKGIQEGDSFMIKHPELETRVRAITINRTQSSASGTNYEVDCQVWPQII